MRQLFGLMQKRTWINALLLLAVFGVFSYHVSTYRYQALAEGDLGCFMAIAEQMHQGQWLYQDVWDNKAPGVFVLHGIAQMCTQNAQYPLVLTLLLVAILTGSIYRRFSQTHPLKCLIWSSAAAYGMWRLFIFWEVSFVGAFTEEWGMLCVLTSFVWILNKNPNSKAYMISGFAFAMAIFIKEPFVFFYPAMVAVILYQNIKYAKPLFLWLLASFLPWLSFALLYVITRRFPALMDYFQGAFAYADANGTILEKFSARLSELLTLMNALPMRNTPWVYAALLFIVLRFIWTLYRRIKYKEIYFWGSLFTAWVFSVGAGALFMSLGPQFYPHYAIPLLIILGSAVLVITGDLFHQITSPLWRLLLPIILLPSLFLMEQPQCMKAQNAIPLPKNAWQEIQSFRSKIPQNETVFVDFEDGGRFYFYLQAQAINKFPVPYPLFFYHPENNQRADVLRNRQLFKNQFFHSPPNYLISRTAFVDARVFDFMKMEAFIDKHYLLIDSVHSSGNTFYIRKLKISKKLK